MKAAVDTIAAGGMSARDTILLRVREALRLPAPMPHFKSLVPSGGSDIPSPHAGGSSSAGHAGLAILPLDVARPWLPDGGDTPESQLAILANNLEKLRAQMHRVADLSAAADFVLSLARTRDWHRVAYHGHALVEPLLAGVPCATYRVDGADAFDKSALEHCDAGITACDAIVAQTGSILVSSATSGGRALSILPHVHIVVATLDQIVSTLGDALHAAKHRGAGRMPSMLSFITGPSRTGDIERILVLGAHGPKELILILVG